MRSGEHDVADAYVLYRERRTRERAERSEAEHHHEQSAINVVDNGISQPLDINKLKALIKSACTGLEQVTNPNTYSPKP